MLTLSIKINIWFSSFVLIILKYDVLAYNLDVDNAKVFNVPKVLNSQRGSYFGFSVALYTDEVDSILLVGAPRANTSLIQNVIEPGTVYQCRINKRCKEWIIDKSGNGNKHEQCSTINQIKDNAWIGATIAIENKTNPRIVWDLILGSPGVYNWKGTPLLATQSIDSEMQTIIPSIKDEKAVQTNNYFGYAVTSGYFTNDQLWFVSSAPRAFNIYGSVIMFTFSNNDNTKLKVKKSLNGEQHGEYFGAVLTSCNLNGDNKDELIVGAPQWSKNMDEGRIYVFTAFYDEIFTKQSFDGKVPGSRFGSAITCLGDIDYDGYGDIAVGAPYEEESGAIYIFNGNSNGLPKHYSQRIIGKQFGSNTRGFGISISEPRDINGDKYSDIAVGAYLSEQTILIKSKPVITITAKLTYNENKKLLRNSTSFSIDMCTYYNGINAPKYLRVLQTLKIDEMYRRAYYGTEKNNNIYKFSDTLHTSKKLCNQLKIYLKENIQNIINPIEIFISINLEKGIKLNDSEIKSNFSQPEIAINKLFSKTEDLIKLPFAVDCGEDNICTSDVKILLSTDLKSNNRYIIGSTLTSKLKIDVFNYGEPAYQAKIFIYIPKILSLASIPPSCMESFYKNNTLEVICDLGNPLRKYKTLTLDLDMTKVQFDLKHVKLWINFNTQSKEKNSFNNTHTLTMYFDADADIAIAGKAQDDLYSYFLEDGDNKLSSVQFQHIYEIQKFGASPINEVILIVNIPTHWKYSTGNIQIININQTIGYMDGQPFHCTHLTTLVSESKIDITTTELYTQEKFTMDTNFSRNFPAENRSVYINCTNTNVECTRIKCKLGPFLHSSSVAKLSLILDFYLSNFKSKTMKEKDIIFFLTNGDINILESYYSTNKKQHKPHNAMIATMFLGSPVTEQIATWIIIVSIIVGILLLILIILALIKIGFFNRKKKKELEALKSEINVSLLKHFVLAL
ncbi:Integrin alpha-5 [Eufriesea mexicana]|uniref:Integrin alpha-5 n=1 Tax=Eufriesea mexicana TaxID=516756 RepID=A0A310SCF3_9HYME|nr:Integrin alpha-5 [Eufriesea mexicana]